jgi:hypothetical protein
MNEPHTGQLKIEFVGVPDHEAEHKAERLRADLERKSPHTLVVQIPDPLRQSAGIVLAITLGPAAALIVAAALEDFIWRDDTSIRVSAAGTPIFEGGRAEASQLPKALASAVTAR